MKQKKIYISGQISGLTVEEYTKKFNYWRDYFLRNGYEVVSPIDLPHKHEPIWSEYLKEDIAALVTCDSIFVMDNWQESKGAKLEMEVARAIMLHFIWEYKTIGSEG